MSTFWVANYHTMMDKARQVSPFCSCDCGLKSLNPMCVTGCNLVDNTLPDKQRFISTTGTQSGHWSWYKQQLTNDFRTYRRDL